MSIATSIAKLMAAWPNCNVPGCNFKVWLGEVEISDKCWKHTPGLSGEPTLEQELRRHTRLKAMENETTTNIYFA